MGQQSYQDYTFSSVLSRIPKAYKKPSGSILPGTAVLALDGLMTGGTTLGVPTDANDADGRAILLTSVGGGATQSGFISAAFTETRTGWNPFIAGKFKLGQIVTQRFWVGLFSASPIAADLPGSVGLVEGVGIRCSTLAPNTNFVAYTSNVTGGVGTENLQDFAVPVPADILVHTFSIEVKANGAGVTIRLDNQERSFLTNLPTVATNLGWCFCINELAAAVKTMRIYSGYIEADR